MRENLIDLIVRLAFEQAAPMVHTLVGHKFPDDDVWLSCWIARKFVPKAANANIVFVRAGEVLPESEGDPSVLHFDTGRGEFDQHGKTNEPSACLLAKHLNLLEDPGLIPLLELAEAVDNVKPLPPTSIHYIVEGYPRMFWENGKGTNWELVQQRVFELFDIVYNQEVLRATSKVNLKRFARWLPLQNGIKLVLLPDHPELREAAYEQGATVVVWTQPQKGPRKFYVGIQCHRDTTVRLTEVAASLRWEECRVRKIDVRNRNLRHLEQDPTWYLHPSLNLILSGSRSHPLTNEEFTKLPPGQIFGIVRYALSKIPARVVAGKTTE